MKRELKNNACQDLHRGNILYLFTRTLSRGILWNIPIDTYYFVDCIYIYTCLLYLAIDNTVANSVNAAYAQCMMGRLGVNRGVYTA